MLEGAVGFNLSMACTNLALYLIFDQYIFLVAAGMFILAAVVKAKESR